MMKLKDLKEKRKYIKPDIEVINIEPLDSFMKLSGWNVDGEHQGGVKEDGDLEWGEND